jgi:anti-sigma factor RsiW
MSRSTAYVCKQFVEDVTAYLEGVLPDDVVTRIDAHLADCPHCREYLEQMRQTVSVVGEIGSDDVDALPEDVRTRLMQAFLEEGA